MPAPTTFLRRLAGAACLALLAAGLSPATPSAHAAGGHVPITAGPNDTYVYLPPVAHLQLLKRPGSHPKPWVGKSGTPRWVGKKPHGRPIVSRLYYAFDLSGLPADAITQAIFHHSQLYSPNHDCFLDSFGPPVKVAVSSVPSSSPRWPGPAVTSTAASSGYAVGNREFCAGGDSQGWDVTEMVRSAAQSSPVIYLRVASSDEHKKSGYRRYDGASGGTPDLELFLHAHPDQPTNLTVDSVVPKSPTSPTIINSASTNLKADLTTPGGCRGTSSVSSCLFARFELTAPDGSVVSAGTNERLDGQGDVAELVQPVGPMEEGVDYVAKVWGLNSGTGLESADPATMTIRYDARPGAPTVIAPQNGWSMGQPITATVTAHDSDAEQVCWQVLTGLPDILEGCADIAPDESSVITLGTLDDLAQLHGTLWVVDTYGSEGSPARISGPVLW